MGHIYENCYKILENVRRDINEYSDNLRDGVDTSGKFSNAYIVDQINSSQRFIHSALMKFIPEEFSVETTITGSNSVFTLPWDFGTLIQFEDENKRKVYPSSIKSTPVNGTTGSKRLYYRKGRTLVLNQSGVNDTYTLKYYRKPRDMTFDQAQSGSTSGTLKMASTAKAKDDYYNGMIFENFTSAFESEITDYVGSTYTASGTGAWTEDDYYGTVSEIPEEFHFLIRYWATILMKEHPASQEKPTEKEYAKFQEMFSSALSGFVGQEEDVSPNDIWTDFGQQAHTLEGINIPGQGYVILS